MTTTLRNPRTLPRCDDSLQEPTERPPTLRRQHLQNSCDAATQPFRHSRRRGPRRCDGNPSDPRSAPRCDDNLQEPTERPPTPRRQHLQELARRCDDNLQGTHGAPTDAATATPSGTRATLRRQPSGTTRSAHRRCDDNTFRNSRDAATTIFGTYGRRPDAATTTHSETRATPQRRFDDNPSGTRGGAVPLSARLPWKTARG